MGDDEEDQDDAGHGDDLLLADGRVPELPEPGAARGRRAALGRHRRRSAHPLSNLAAIGWAILNPSAPTARRRLSPRGPFGPARRDRERAAWTSPPNWWPDRRGCEADADVRVARRLVCLKSAVGRLEQLKHRLASFPLRDAGGRSDLEAGRMSDRRSRRHGASGRPRGARLSAMSPASRPRTHRRRIGPRSQTPGRTRSAPRRRWRRPGSPSRGRARR